VHGAALSNVSWFVVFSYYFLLLGSSRFLLAVVLGARTVIVLMMMVVLVVCWLCRWCLVMAMVSAMIVVAMIVL
jgi:hypothetical protein